MKFLLYVLIFSLAVFGCQKCPEYYNSQPSKEVYYSTFSVEPDEYFWTGNDGLHYAEISNGEYYFESLDTFPRFNAPKFPIQIESDFELECSITGPERDVDGSYGVVLGDFLPDSTKINFEIDNSGNYSIENGTYKISQGKFGEGTFDYYKKLTVRKIDNQLYFFINEKLILSYPCDPMINVRFGPITEKGSSVWLDFVKVRILRPQ